MKKGLLLGVLLAVYALLAVQYFFPSPRDPHTGTGHAAQGDGEGQPGQPIYPELETGIGPAGLSNAEARRRINKALAQLSEEDKDLDRRLIQERRNIIEQSPNKSRPQYPPGDWNLEPIGMPPSDSSKPGLPLMRDLGFGGRRGAP